VKITDAQFLDGLSHERLDFDLSLDNFHFIWFGDNTVWMLFVKVLSSNFFGSRSEAFFTSFEELLTVISDFLIFNFFFTDGRFEIL
jgi:hypothetical protein